MIVIFHFYSFEVVILLPIFVLTNKETNKYSTKMEIIPTTEKINVRGAINSLEIGSEPLELQKIDYKLSSVRATAGSITGDTGKTFTVTTTKYSIIVTRNS